VSPAAPAKPRGAAAGNAHARRDKDAGNRPTLCFRVAPKTKARLTAMAAGRGLGQTVDALLALDDAPRGSVAPSYLRDLAVWIYAEHGTDERMRDVGRALNEAAEAIRRGGAR
jgi:hypothetical protein